MRRWLFKCSLAMVVGLLLAAITSPWWLGGVLGWAAPRWLGVEFDRYERLEGARVAIDGIVVRRDGVTVRVDSLEADSPWRWLGAWLTGGRTGDIAVGEWAVVVTPKATDDEPDDQPGGWAATLRSVESTLDTLSGWLPPAGAEAGSVRWPGGELRIGPASLREERLEATFVEWAGRRAEDVVLERRDTQWRLSTHGAENFWELDARLAGEEIHATGNLWDQPWTLHAVFGPEGWKPRTAGLEADGWVLPGARFGWEQAYREISGDLRAEWSGERLTFEVEASGEPVGDAPPLQVSLAGGGDERELVLRSATVRAPGVTATLDEPVRVTPEGRLLSETSRFSLQADLAKWSGGTARGVVEGRLSVRPGEENRPEIDAGFTAKDVELRGWLLEALEVDARLRWPDIIVTKALVTLPGKERLNASGRYDLTSRVLSDGELSGRLTEPTLRPWLPAGAGVGEVELTVAASGVWPRLEHEGEFGFKALGTDWLKPVDGEVRWAGRGPSAHEFRLELRAKDAALVATGALDREALDLAELRLTGGDVLEWRLTEPARVRWAPAPRISNLALEGASGRLRASGDASGFLLDAESVGTEWLQPWLKARVPNVLVERLKAQAAWDQGPLLMTLRGRARLPLAGEQAASAELDLVTGLDGVWLKTLSIEAGDEPVANAGGHLPLIVRPADDERFEWLPNGQLALTARTDPSASFWHRLAELSGLTIENPSADIAVKGTWRKPEGSATLSVTRIAADPERWPQALPELQNLNARLRGGVDGLFLEELTAEVAGQRVIAEGGLKASPDRWPALLREPARLVAEGGTLKLRLPDAEVAALARFMPEVLAPAGRLQLELALREGGGWDGFLKLSGAASRPLGPLGILGDVNADIRLHDRSLELANVSARVGGQPVVLAGSLDLSDWRRPAPALTLRGKNLPLVRRSGVLIRSDLDLKAVTDAANGRVTVGGEVRLHDSLLLADLRSLLPSGGGPRGPARRPPYFSVDVEPLDGWALDVALRGERFLRVRTPLFNGIMSARFRLGGTLGEPTLAGDAPVDEGVVRLPFANFTMEQGRIYISAADPSAPRLRLAATGRSYGYDLRMELSGPASSPELTFSSTPPLSSEQVLLMVMAGETPSNEITYTTSQRAVRVGAYLGQSLLDTFGVRTGASDRLTINVGERISRQGRETYDVTYELTDDWSLTGEYSEFDDYNAGVKWRFYTSKPEKEKEGDDDAR